jgi:hypothetical protein
MLQQGGWKDSPWPKRVMDQLMKYNILGFSVWDDDGKFGSTFDKLIDGLELFCRGWPLRPAEGGTPPSTGKA